MKNRILASWLPRLAACALAALAAAPAPAGAEHFVVDSSQDSPDYDLRDGECRSHIQLCTLRAAVEQSNYLGGPHTIALRDRTHFLEDRLDVEAEIQITGKGSGVTRIDCEHGPGSLVVTGALELYDLSIQRCRGSENHGVLRLFRTAIAQNLAPAIRNFRKLEVGGSTFQGNTGDPGTPGGAILNEPDAWAAILESVFEFNVSSTVGGAILNHGEMIIGASQFLDNLAWSQGGGVYNTGKIDIDEVTFRRNSAEDGGALYSQSPGQVRVWRSSFVENEASSRGGAILSASSTHLVSSTVSGNWAYAGGGLYGLGEPDVLWLANATVTENIAAPVDNTPGGEGGGLYGAAVLQNTILAGNTSNGPGQDCFGGATPPVSRDHNILGVEDDCGMSLSGRDQAGTERNPLEPRLLPLDDTTRHPPFHEPDRNSVAVDSGDPNGCLTPDEALIGSDQLANPRHQGPACDAGAVETTP